MTGPSGERVRIGINGLGRIGRACLNLSLKDADLRVVAANDLVPQDNLAYLLKFDSVHGRSPHEVTLKGDSLLVDDREIRLLASEKPQKLPWGRLGVDVVIEATGRFRSARSAATHLSAGAHGVVITANPADGGSGTIPVFLRGVNETDFAGASIISAGSCSANAAGGPIKILADRYGIDHAFLTTVHAYTQDQRILESGHPRDWRRGRAAACNIVPSPSDAARVLCQLMPGLENRLSGLAVRVPVPDGSMMEMRCCLRAEVSPDEVNSLLREKSGAEYAGLIACSDEPMVSRDIVNDTRSIVIDSQLTSVSSRSLLTLVGWFDHEWGYAARVLELAKMVLKQNS